MNKFKIGIIITITVILVTTISLTIDFDKLDENENSVIERHGTDVDELVSYGWIKSGPFYLDKEEYSLGEKIFLNVQDISQKDKGKILVLRPINDTHKMIYLDIPFDGMKKSAFNYFFLPSLNENKEVCSIDDLIGTWQIVFGGTEYSPIQFEMLDEIKFARENQFTPVC